MIRLGAVGDVVRTLPAVSALRAAYPGAHLSWLVERASASLLEGQPWLDEVLIFPREGLRESLRRAHLRSFATTLVAFLRELRERRFELVLDFHGILKSGLLARASGAPLRAGFAAPFGREGAWLFSNARARLMPAHVSRFERNAGLLRFLGVRAHPAAQPLYVSPEDLARAQRLLGGGPASAALHPGTSDTTPHKRYTVEGYAALARALLEREGVACVVTRGPARDDLAVAEAVVKAANGAARLAPPTPSLRELAALFAGCRLTIGSDTGPLHVASLVGTPVVQILGPTDPLENEPWPGTPMRQVRVPVACSPCRRGCAAATCMRVVPAGLVLAAAHELLAGGAGRAELGA